MEHGYKKREDMGEENGPYHQPKGADIEKSMLQFLLDIGVDVQEDLIFRNRHQDVACFIPFSNRDKIKVTCRIKRTHENSDEQKVYIILQGAPEQIIHYCSKTFNDDIQDDDFGSDDKAAALGRAS